MGSPITDMKVLLLVSSFIAVTTASLDRLQKTKQCEGTECPGGCCPEVGWYCCPDNVYCAASAADCPFVARTSPLLALPAPRQCGHHETDCPGGCCPLENGYCCPDAYYCAQTAPECP